MAEVTKAKVSDAEALHQIARRLSLEGRDLTSAVQSGFLLYVGPVEDYRKTIAESGHCYVAREDAKVIGFLTAMTPRMIAALPPGPNRDLFDEKGEFPLLIEQIGVGPEFQNRGTGQQLLEALLEGSDTPRLMATLVHAPVRNERSIRFLARNGWRLWREVRTEKRVWGFYEFRRGTF